MEQKLTAQIASAYFGCPMLVTHRNIEGNPVIGRVKAEFIQDLEESPNGYPYQLILRRLDKISDEDVMAIFDFISCKNGVKIKSKRMSVSDGYSIQYLYTDSKGNIENGIGSAAAYTLPLSSWDYLRSVGYDCGYGSIPSLIQVGIAIDSTTLNDKV